MGRILEPGIDFPYNFHHKVSAGRIDRHEHIFKFGRNSDIDTGVAEDIWDGGGAYSWPTTAQTVNLVSTSANDDESNTGAETVLIYGLDSDYNEISETITLNGTSNVVSTNSYLRLYRMIVTGAGSGGANAGDISATQTTSAIKMAQINTGNNQTLMAQFTIPNGKTAYLYQGTGGVNKATSAAVNIVLKMRPLNQVFQVKGVWSVASTGVSSISINFLVLLRIESKTDITIVCDTSANNSDVSCSYSLILEDD